MPKVSGIFDSFENLENIPSENIARWLKGRLQSHFLENYLANRVIYPQVIPVGEELSIDLAILREALRRNPVFFNHIQKKIFIPESFLQVMPDFKKLALVFIEALRPNGLVTLILSKKSGDKILGSLITVSCTSGDTLYFGIEGRNYKVKPGSLTVLPCPSDHCHVNFKSESSTIFGKNELIFEVPGGDLGLIVDGRENESERK